MIEARILRACEIILAAANGKFLLFISLIRLLIHFNFNESR